MAEKVSTLKRNILYGLLCWKKILHRQVVNVRKKNYITRGLGKKILTKPNHPSLPPPPSPFPPPPLPTPPPSKSNALPLTKFSCSDWLPISIIGMGIRYKNWLAITN